jgi:hypothetical protein
MSFGDASSGPKESEAESPAIAGNPFASARFQALVPEMEHIFSGGWKCPEKAKHPLCRGFWRWD